MGLFSSDKNVDPGTGRDKATSARMRAEKAANQAKQDKQNARTRKMLQQNVSKRKSAWN